MKINSIKIDNFRGIDYLEAASLGGTIIIAGQNGSGKSCIFDAIRLLKSTYGGYQHNEWQSFFGEFSIQLHGPKQNLNGLFYDKRKNITIEASFSVGEEERKFISANARDLLEQTIWQSLVPEAFQFGGFRQALFSSQFRDRQPEVDGRISAELPEMMKELSQKEVLGKIYIQPNGLVSLHESPLLSMVFSNYRPKEIGVIDFHGAQRHYGRESVQGINLSLGQYDQNKSAHALYNYSNKYANVKSEMAANFVKEILAERADPASAKEASLSQTLKELFEVFFPDKKFGGAIPTKDGGLEFPVITSGGGVHDLDELSSGEKEILYGYLRIRSSAPRNSIILLDEPELHLNPRLIRRLPEFYKKHLGENLKNQLWLITHSDALIREAVGRPGFNVFHMTPATSEAAGVSQLRELSLTEDLDAAVTDLVGDLAAYRPGGKGVIFEGGGDSDFDRNMVSRLFSDELKGINLISGSNKNKVRALHEILERAWKKGDLPTKFFSITDKDFEADNVVAGAVTNFAWDVYHIENFLLNISFISDALKSVLPDQAWSEERVSKALDSAAREVVPSVVEQKMRNHVNHLIVSSISLGFKPGTVNLSKDLAEASMRSSERVGKIVETKLTVEELLSVEKELSEEIERSFSDGSWVKTLPGREILKRFAGGVGLSYDIIRNLILSKMVDKGHQPEGMKNIIEKIVSA